MTAEGFRCNYFAHTLKPQSSLKYNHQVPFYTRKETQNAFVVNLLCKKKRDLWEKTCILRTNY